MNDKWTQGKLVTSTGWVESYSRFPQKAWSFGLCAFVLFALVFVGKTGVALVIALFMSFIAGINLLINREPVNKEMQSIITIMGYIVSTLQIIYANV